MPSLVRHQVPMAKGQGHERAESCLERQLSRKGSASDSARGTCQAASGSGRRRQCALPPPQRARCQRSEVPIMNPEAIRVSTVAAPRSDPCPSSPPREWHHPGPGELSRSMCKLTSIRSDTGRHLVTRALGLRLSQG